MTNIDNLVRRTEIPRTISSSYSRLSNYVFRSCAQLLLVTRRHRRLYNKPWFSSPTDRQADRQTDRQTELHRGTTQQQNNHPSKQATLSRSCSAALYVRSTAGHRVGKAKTERKKGTNPNFLGKRRRNAVFAHPGSTELVKQAGKSFFYISLNESNSCLLNSVYGRFWSYS